MCNCEKGDRECKGEDPFAEIDTLLFEFASKFEKSVIREMLTVCE